MRHLHFVQSLEALQGGGLGSATLQLHSALSNSRVIATKELSFTGTWEGVVQCVRNGPDALYYSAKLGKLAGPEVASADWVHAHGLYVYTNFVAGREARIQGKPYAYHIHGFFDPWILGRSRWKKRIVNAFFESRNVQEANFLRALTIKEERQIRSLGLKNPVAVIPNGIDLAAADDSVGSELGLPYSVRKRPKRVLFLSRLHPKKGLEMLLESWAKLQCEFRDWELALVGPDEKGYQASLERLIVQHGIGDSCSIFPPVFGDLKHAILASADLFVLPSFSEGFPMAVLEAAAHRLPIVMTTECNFPELKECGGAWECAPEQELLTVALKEALSSSEDERAQRGEAARFLVESRYTWEQVAKSLEEACETYE